MAREPEVRAGLIYSYEIIWLLKISNPISPFTILTHTVDLMAAVGKGEYDVILIQDVTNTNNSVDNETLIFSVPIHFKTWSFWHAQAEKDNSFEDDMAYVMTKDADENGVMVILPKDTQPDSHCVYIAARVRLVRDFHGRIYVVRATYTPWTKSQVTYAMLGGDHHAMQELELDGEPSE